MAALAQELMLGMHVMGLKWTLPHTGFSVLTEVFLTIGYSFIGATWIIHKVAGGLQIKPVTWARVGIRGLALGIADIGRHPAGQHPDLWEVARLVRGALSGPAADFAGPFGVCLACYIFRDKAKELRHD